MNSQTFSVGHLLQECFLLMLLTSKYHTCFFIFVLSVIYAVLLTPEYCRLGIKHVKGMLLYGPPGTGKTLMARQIGKLLNGKDPKVWIFLLGMEHNFVV